MNRNPKTWFRFQISGLTGYGNQSWYVGGEGRRGEGRGGEEVQRGIPFSMKLGSLLTKFVEKAF